MKLNFVTKIFLIALAFTLIFLLAPTFNISGLDSVFNAVTFMFGVLYGFEISIVLGNFVTLKSSLAQLNAQLRSIYFMLKSINPKAAETAADKIESYLMKSIDIDLNQHYETEKEFTELVEMGKEKEIKQATLDDADSQGVRVQFVYQALYDLTNTRNQIEQVSPRFIELPEWIMLCALAAILIVILFLQRVDATTSLTSCVLSTMIVGSLIILADIDSNDLQEGFLEYTIFNETLSQIGKEKYYPQFAIDQSLVKPRKGSKYRIGVFPRYPDLDERVIKDSR